MIVSANFPRRHRLANQELIQRGDGGEARLWHIGTALAVSFTLAVVGLAGLAWLAWVLLGLAGYRHHGAPALHDTVSVLQLVFASVAGAGALVALIVAYRRQKIAEADSVHERTRVFNERFTAIAAQFGDAQPAVRLAGVHAMAGLGDDWKQNRQTCIDVLCAYLRLPADPDPGDDSDPAERTAYRANREVRHTIIRLIGAHLRPGAAVSWQGLNFDFTGVVFDGGDFTAARFSGGIALFTDAVFPGGRVSFVGAEFSGAQVDFGRAKFSGSQVDFGGAKFSGSQVSFGFAEFSGSQVDFGRAKFSGGQVSFVGAEFSGGQARFDFAEFSGGQVDFGAAGFSGSQVGFVFAEFSGGQVDILDAEFSGGKVSFFDAKFSGGKVVFDLTGFSGSQVGFVFAKFSGGQVDFGGVEFSAGEVSFEKAVFSAGRISFNEAEFSGSRVSFEDAIFSGGQVDFADPKLWSHPPVFGWNGTPPAEVVLPDQRGILVRSVHDNYRYRSLRCGRLRNLGGPLTGICLRFYASAGRQRALR